MKRIVILGNSPAGVKAIEEIRRNDTSSEITLVTFDEHYPYNRELFADFMAQRISSEKVFCRSKDFYVQQKVEVVLDRKINRINFKRNRIFLEDKEHIDYDVLLMTEALQHKFPDIKGTNKIGVYGLKTLREVQSILDALPLTDTVSIQSHDIQGLKAAAALMEMGKEVFLILPESAAQNCTDPTFDTIEALSTFEEKGGRIIRDTRIDELLGESDVKAVRLTSGKVIAAQMVIFTQTSPNLKLFQDTPLQVNERVLVDHQFKTNIGCVFAVDDFCEFEGQLTESFPLSWLEEQGKSVAASIAEDSDIPVEV